MALVPRGRGGQKGNFQLSAHSAQGRRKGDPQTKYCGNKKQETTNKYNNNNNNNNNNSNNNKNNNLKSKHDARA